MISEIAYGTEKARKEFGCSPAYSLEDASRETVEWHKQNGIVQ
jgi:nucleoside-diphosphate-sugar epimerase